MINEDHDVALSILQPNKSGTKATPISEVTIESVFEQEYTEKSTHGPYKNIREPADCSSVECSSIFRPKSPSNRPYTCPKLSRCKLYQGRVADSIRKTKSTALPATQLVRNNWQLRGETVSTPDLPDNGRRNSDLADKHRSERQERVHLNRVAICYDNVRWIGVFLNSVILILSLLYFGSGLSFIYFKELLLLIMKTREYVLLIVFFFVISFFFWAIGLSGLYTLWKMTRRIKIHTGLTLIFSILTASIIFLQCSIQRNIEVDIESQLNSSITLNSEDYVKDSWDYFHNRFKCCGVTGFLDWCYQGNLYSKINGRKPGSYLGTYVCSIPSSCCTKYQDEIDNHNINKNATCLDLLKSEKMPNSGCIIAIRREIAHLGKMYKMITGGSAVTLILLTIASTVLFTCFMR